MLLDLSNTEVTNYAPLPDAKYVCNVTEAEIKDTKSGTGQYISATLTIAEGEFEGRKIFTNFNVKNENPKAVEIGLSQLKSLLIESGYKDPNTLGSVTDICGLRVGVKTKTKEDPAYGPKTEVSFYFNPKATTGQTGQAKAGW